MDLRAIIVELNPVLRGWGKCFPMGNAVVEFVQLDTYLERRLRGLRLQRAGSRLRETLVIDREVLEDIRAVFAEKRWKPREP
jgi:hypothetical protein